MCHGKVVMERGALELGAQGGRREELCGPKGGEALAPKPQLDKRASPGLRGEQRGRRAGAALTASFLCA